MMLHQLISFSRKLGIAVLALIVVVLGPAGAAIFVVGRAIATISTNVLEKVGFNRIFSFIAIGQRTPSQVAGTIVLVAFMIFAATEVANLLGFKIPEI